MKKSSEVKADPKRKLPPLPAAEEELIGGNRRGLLIARLEVHRLRDHRTLSMANVNPHRRPAHARRFTDAGSMPSSPGRSRRYAPRSDAMRNVLWLSEDAR